MLQQDEIIELAMNSGLPSKEAAQHQLWWLEAFAKLVDAKATAKERELCITDIQWHIPRSGRNDPEYLRAKSMIERIRARGEPTSRGEQHEQ